MRRRISKCDAYRRTEDSLDDTEHVLDLGADPRLGPVGGRLAELRKSARYTQVEFAAELAITQRMVAYSEASDAQPPAHLLPQMAQALGIGVDVLLGIEAPRRQEARD